MKAQSITIYDYDDVAKEIALPDKEIRHISVSVLSGDETGEVVFADGERLQFDASDCRIYPFYDGFYSVSGDDVQKWIEFKFSGERTKSYERQEAFD